MNNYSYLSEVTFTGANKELMGKIKKSIGAGLIAIFLAGCNSEGAWEKIEHIEPCGPKDTCKGYAECVVGDSVVKGPWKEYVYDPTVVLMKKNKEWYHYIPKEDCDVLLDDNVSK